MDVKKYMFSWMLLLILNGLSAQNVNTLEWVKKLNSEQKYTEALDVVSPLNMEDIHLLFEMNQILSFEVGSNSSGIGHIGFGVNLFDIFGSSFDDLIHLNYSYNPNVLKAGSIFGNTHEIHLSYSFEK